MKTLYALAVAYVVAEIFALYTLNKQPHATDPCQDEYSMHLVCPHPEHRGEVVDGHLLCKCVHP